MERTTTRDLLFELRDWLDGICFGHKVADKQAREFIARLNEVLHIEELK